MACKHLSPKAASVKAVRWAAARAFKAQGLVQRSPSPTRPHMSRHCRHSKISPWQA